VGVGGGALPGPVPVLGLGRACGGCGRGRRALGTGLVWRFEGVLRPVLAAGPMATGRRLIRGGG